MDTNQFTQQLVKFSQVEQQISTNDNLEVADLARPEPRQHRTPWAISARP